MAMNTKDRITELRQLLTELVAGAPELTQTLRGTVCQRYVRCGKKDCHCKDGDGHGPVYFISVSLGVGRTKQVTLTADTYEVAARYSRNYARLQEVLEEVSAINRELLDLERRTSRGERHQGGK